MEDKDENQINNQDDFEFEKYPEDDEKNISNIESSQISDDILLDQDDDGFEKYKEDDNDSSTLVPVPPFVGGLEVENMENSNNQPDEFPVIKMDPKEKARRVEIRARIKEEKRRKREEKEKKRRNMVITVVVFGILLFIMWLVYFTLTDVMPEQLINQGKKYLEVHEYKKAMNMFKLAGDAKPYDEDPIYYQAVALSKMPLTYENQKALYEISQLEDFDKASKYADAVLTNIRKQIDKKIGSNYVDNVLYDDIVFRWNTDKPINYFISNNSNVTREYMDTIRSAFSLWSTASNGELIFRETMTSSDADIIVSLLNNIVMNSNRVSDINKSGNVTPIINNNVLEKVEVDLKTNYTNGRPYELGGFRMVAQHEIGHALGIWGHSSNPNDIMYYAGDYINEVNPNKSFSKRDINTLNLLYKMVPDIINTPIDPKEYDNLFYHYIITTFPGEDFELEMQRLLASLRDDTRNIPAWVDLAINYGIKKQYKRSNTILKSILPLTRNYSQFQFVILYNMAANYYKMKDYRTTEKLLQMTKMYGEDLDVHILEAFNDLKLDRIELGRGKLEVLNNKYPEHIEIALKLAQVYYFENEKLKAKEVIEKLLKVNPDAIRDRRVQKYRKYLMKYTAKEK